MCHLTRLEISGIRNLLDVRLEPDPATNLIYGANGSGKTSLLEAVHLLATGRSFRSGRAGSLINHGRDSASVFIRLSDGGSIGLEKTRQRGNSLRLDGRNQPGWEAVARRLPLQVLDAHSFQLLEGGPKARRRFLDWGVFHMEHAFLAAWRDARRCLANRNLLLKRHAAGRAGADFKSQIAAWDRQLSAAAEKVDTYRRAYFAAFLPRAETTHQSLTAGDGSDPDPAGSSSQENSTEEGSAGTASVKAKSLKENSVGANSLRKISTGEGSMEMNPPQVSMRYERGWDNDRPLLEVLQEGLPTDLKYRATQQGPHRADIAVRCGRGRAVEVLSRGQQKLLVCALKLAQGGLLSESLGRHCLYLADDLAAELDERNTAAVLATLQSQSGQLFATSTTPHRLDFSSNPTPPPMFHLKQGHLTTP